jgi:hypothetical protein
MECHKSTDVHIIALSLWPKDLPKVLHPNIIVLVVKFQHVNLGEYTQTLTLRLCLLFCKIK